MRYFRFIKQTYSKIRIEFKRNLWNILRHFTPSLTLKTTQGKYRVLTKDRIISRSLFSEGQYEYDLMQRFFEYVQKNNSQSGGVIVDIGANLGITTITALLKYEYTKAVSIEPDPTNFSLLTHNVRINNLAERVVCVQSAVSDTKGTIEFELCETNLGDHRVRVHNNAVVKEKFQESDRQVITVPKDTLEHILTEHHVTPKDLSLVWIDVQGHEGFVYQGAQSLFKTGVPVVSEIWPYGIYRTGMTKEEFCDIVASIWTHVIIPRRNNTFVTYPISFLTYFMDELVGKNDYENVIFVRQR